MNDDWTDFEDGERNGWEIDVGSLDGILKTEEGPNTFWSGKLEWRPPYIFQPSLAKMFTLLESKREGSFSHPSNTASTHRNRGKQEKPQSLLQRMYRWAMPLFL